MLAKLIQLGKKIYRMENPRERRRFYVFVVRAWLHKKEMQRLFGFFAQTKLLQDIARLDPFVFEQPTRAFFYNKSTMAERSKLVEEHFEFLTQRLQPDALQKIYSSAKVELWQDGFGLEEQMHLYLCNEAGQRKEGMLSVMLDLEQEHLYQMMFWIARDREQKWALWIGAMQGPNMDDAKDVVKRITKRCYAYRTKSFILYCLQAVARSLGVERIYAVTNYGYYANNHVRVDRKLKTSFSDFWTEAGGSPTDDRRFDTLPLTEPRKTLEEVKAHKRNQYRKRYVFLDEVDAVIAQNMEKIL